MAPEVIHAPQAVVVLAVKPGGIAQQVYQLAIGGVCDIQAVEHRMARVVDAVGRDIDLPYIIADTSVSAVELLGVAAGAPHSHGKLRGEARQV